MGCIHSTPDSINTQKNSSSSSSSSNNPSLSKLHLTPDLTSYQEACRSDPELQSFDSALQYKTSRVINSLALGVEVRSLSLDSLQEVTASLLDMNQEVFKQFESLDSPFSPQFFELFQSVYKQQVSMVRKLNVQKRKVDKKLKRAVMWRRLTNVIFVITFITVLICSVVAAAVAAPPLVTALAAAAVVPLGSMGKWVNSLWKKYETGLKGQRELINAMRMGNFIAIKDLDNIKALVDKLGVEMEGLVQNAQFAVNEEEEEAVVMAVEEMKKTVNDFAKTIDDLSDHSNKCSRDVRRARTVIVQKITKHPSGSV